MHLEFAYKYTFRINRNVTAQERVFGMYFPKDVSLKRVLGTCIQKDVSLERVFGMCIQNTLEFYDIYTSSCSQSTYVQQLRMCFRDVYHEGFFWNAHLECDFEMCIPNTLLWVKNDIHDKYDKIDK